MRTVAVVGWVSMVSLFASVSRLSLPVRSSEVHPVNIRVVPLDLLLSDSLRVDDSISLSATGAAGHHLTVDVDERLGAARDIRETE